MDDGQLRLDLDLPPTQAPEAPVRSPKTRGAAHTRRLTVRPFSYTDAMWEVVRDIVATLDEFRHVDLDRVLLSIAQARQNSTHGVYASCVPLRFAGGATETVVQKRRYRMPPLHHQGREILYVLYFMLPRFHEEQEYPEKLATIIHELYHISPHFNGDIRRFPGKNFAHGHSRDVYHAAMRKLAARYLATSPRANDHEFLKVPFPELLKRPGGVTGLCISKPKALLVTPPAKPTRR
jgi:predicted metallopeptidase